MSKKNKESITYFVKNGHAQILEHTTQYDNEFLLASVQDYDDCVKNDGIYILSCRMYYSEEETGEYGRVEVPAYLEFEDRKIKKIAGKDFKTQTEIEIEKKKNFKLKLNEILKKMKVKDPNIKIIDRTFHFYGDLYIKLNNVTLSLLKAEDREKHNFKALREFEQRFYQPSLFEYKTKK